MRGRTPDCNRSHLALPCLPSTAAHPHIPRERSRGPNHQNPQLLEETRKQAIDRMVRNATAMGANAVVMMRFDSSEIGQTMSEIVAYGTAGVHARAHG